MEYAYCLVDKLDKFLTCREKQATLLRNAYPLLSEILILKIFLAIYKKNLTIAYKSKNDLEKTI